MRKNWVRDAKYTTIPFKKLFQFVKRKRRWCCITNNKLIRYGSKLGNTLY